MSFSTGFRKCKKCGKTLFGLFDGELCDKCEKAEQEPISVNQDTVPVKLRINKVSKHISNIDLDELEQEPCEDAVSRQAVLDGIEELKQSPWFNDDTHEAKIIRQEAVEIVKDLCVKQLPSVRPQEQTGHCKDCKYFEYDSWLYVNEIPLILAHEVCNRWAGGWKTKEDGFCFMFERGDTE